MPRRRFHLLGLAALASGLGACGGGGGSPLVEGAAPEPSPPRGPAPLGASAASQAPAAVGAGMQGLTAWTVAGPVPQDLVLKDIQPLADGRVALAWVESPAPGKEGPRRLHLRAQSCQGGCGGTDQVLAEGLVDAGTAVSVLPDGSTLVAWRDTLERVPGHELSIQCRLFLQRFGPGGAAAGAPELVDAFLFSNRLEGGGRGMGPPAIGHWGNGSFVVTWADIRTFASFPGLATSVRARRYHFNGWPVGPAQTVATSYRERTYTLDLPPASGGYVISHVQEPQAPFHQAIVPIDFWNPLPAQPLARLLPGSFLLSIGIYGSLLFAGRTDPGTGQPVYTRERFDYSGQPVGSPAPLASLPLGALALRDIEYLALSAGARAGFSKAQRMDKYGRMIGLPFELPQGPTALLEDGSLLVAWTTAGLEGSRVMLQRFVPTAASPGLAAG